jgi:hypothetical protein
MKKQLSILLLSFTLFGSLLKAQSAEQWQPVIVTSGGTNTVNGVEVNYLFGNEAVIVKLVNHSTSAVKVSWKDLVVTKSGKSLSGANKDESVTIAPKIRVSDDDGNTVQVTLKLSDFKTTADDFKSYAVSGFDVISMQ